MSKRKVFLSYKTDNHCDTGNKHLARRWVPSQNIHTQFQAEIVDQEIEAYDEYVAPELSRTAQVGACESDIFVKPKACKQSDWKNNAECCDVRRHAKLMPRDGKILQIVPDTVIIYKEIEHPIKYRITPAANSIPEQLLRDEFFERAVKKLYDFCNYSCKCLHLSKKSCNFVRSNEILCKGTKNFANGQVKK